MQAEEFRCGLHTLGILHETTLPYSPYQYVAPTFMSCWGLRAKRTAVTGAFCAT
jgi:hypothetical protein